MVVTAVAGDQVVGQVQVTLSSQESVADTGQTTHTPEPGCQVSHRAVALVEEQQGWVTYML